MQVSYVQKQMYAIWFSKYRKLKNFSSENYRLFHLKSFLTSLFLRGYNLQVLIRQGALDHRF